MRIRTKTVIAVLFSIFLGCSHSPDLSAQTRKSTPTSKTVRSNKSNKAGRISGAQLTMGLLANAMKNAPSISNITSVVTLDKELAWAKTIATKSGEKIKDLENQPARLFSVCVSLKSDWDNH